MIYFKNLNNSYAQLPSRFYQEIKPEKVSKPELILFNKELAIELNLRSELIMNKAMLADIFSGNKIPNGSNPVAMAYAGHQFGNFVPQLGDGRAILLGELKDNNGNTKDIQLKGSGKTAFSRSGDGKSPLGPALREYIVSEAMYRLGIPTARSLAVVKTGDNVYRENISPGGVLTRVASSHIRIGTFEYFAARRDFEAIKILADYSISRHYPELISKSNKYLVFFKEVMKKQAYLVSKWMANGFIHGVMNTDNTTISGETIDYGPCAFMEEYNPDTVFSSIDRFGRYSYNNQQNIIVWNMARLGECLMPIIHNNNEYAVALINDELKKFPDIFHHFYYKEMCSKIGLEVSEESKNSVNELLQIMKNNNTDFTQTFRYLGNYISGNPEKLLNLFHNKKEINNWLKNWEKNLPGKEEKVAALKSILNNNPIYIPRNHKVEEAINSSSGFNNHTPLIRLLNALSLPYTEISGLEEFIMPAAEGQKVLKTFCGT